MKLNKKAFTLVEMLIVVVIIGILAAALLPKLLSAQGRARDTARKADLTQILTSLKMYYDDEGEYPTYTDTKGCASTTFKSKMEPYMSEVPSDPQKNREIDIDGDNTEVCEKDYAYMPLKSSGTDGGAAVLAANLEVFGKSMNWVLNLNTDTYYLSGTTPYTDDDQGEMRDLVKGKCSEGVFYTGGTTSTQCGGTTTKGWATTDGVGVYVVFPN